jgi:hypothetical protein
MSLLLLLLLKTQFRVRSRSHARKYDFQRNTGNSAPRAETPPGSRTQQRASGVTGATHMDLNGAQRLETAGAVGCSERARNYESNAQGRHVERRSDGES